jgi:hypothetical protein
MHFHQMACDRQAEPGLCEAKDNPRFVVTNKRQSPKLIYQKAYCSRGEIENRIKELQLGMEIERTGFTSMFV